MGGTTPLPAIVEVILMEMGANVKTLTVGEPKNHAITAVQEAIDAADEVISLPALEIRVVSSHNIMVRVQ